MSYFSRTQRNLRFWLNSLRWLLRRPAGHTNGGVRGWMHETVFPTDAAVFDEPGMEFLSTKRVIGSARIVMIALAVGFFGWAALAPLDSAIMASGVITVASHRKVIQHLDSGIVEDVLVKEGQKVAAGQPLLKLDDTQARANLNQLVGEQDALEAEQARLIAERDGKDSIAFPPDLMSRAQDPTVAEAMRGEENSFETRKQTLQQQIDILSQRDQENDTIVAGLESELSSLEEQKKLFGRETASIQSLYDKGLATLPRLLTLQRQSADVNGQRGQILEKMAQTKLGSGENQLQIASLRNERLDDVLKNLRDTQTKLFDLGDRVHAARDVLARLDVRSPVTGRVVGLKVHTRGAVIGSGETLMDVVPDDNALEIEARVRPQDADGVYAGMTAKVTLSAYQSRRLPVITGTIKNVSADTLTDERTGQPYFGVQISIDRRQLKDYPDARLMPGMPVEVAIDTGKRTAFQYLTEPITDVFHGGMREK